MSTTWKHIAEVRRILQNEQGATVKEWGGRLPVALIYPNTYYVGMSSLGLHTVCRLFNDHDDVVCERVFWNEGAPLLSIEGQRPLADFAVLAFTVSYELDYLNVVEMLRAAGIPRRADERDRDWPLLIAGGPAVTANPEPLAPFCDAFAIGEGEVIIPPLLDTLREGISGDREELLRALSTVHGLYVPHLPGAQPPVARQWVRDLDAWPTATVVYTADTEFGDRTLIEVSRGCGRGCRFCLAGFCYRPPRERSVEALLAQAREGLRHRESVGLVGAAVSDYSRINELVAGLREMGAGVSVSSLRVDPLPDALLQVLVESGTRTLTIAPETGSQKLRTAINKGVSEDDVLRAAHTAASHGFAQLKLYFMVGLPGETEDDVQAIVDLALAVADRFQRQVTVNLTPFVPKAHTPFQWAAMADVETLRARITHVQRALRRRGVAVRAESPAWAAVQGVLARGDRRVGAALLALERPTLSGWRKALAAVELDQTAYLDEWALDAPLPWQVVSSGADVAYLRREWEQARDGRETAPCPHERCRLCNVCE
ncbi:MAG: radical SAM protein [Chloroflexota bacterium]|nr:radical SAM protein [Chloroflexota bacterium]